MWRSPVSLIGNIPNYVAHQSTRRRFVHSMGNDSVRRTIQTAFRRSLPDLIGQRIFVAPVRLFAPSLFDGVAINQLQRALAVLSAAGNLRRKFASGQSFSNHATQAITSK